MTRIKLDYTDLIDKRNAQLIDLIVKQNEIKIELSRDYVNGKPYWSIDFDICFQKAKIYAGEKGDDINSFTHELLHIAQEINGQQSHKTLATYVGVKSSSFVSLFTIHLCTQINNVIMHQRMYPEYLKMGFKKDCFIYDYDVIPDSKEYMHVNFQLNNGDGVDTESFVMFLFYYFTYRFHPNDFVKSIYEKDIISKYEVNHADLVISMDALCDDWNNNKIIRNDEFFNKLLVELDNWKDSHNYC